MSTRMKLLPVIIMLLAGACTSVITWLLGYDSKTAVWVLVGVLVFFYIIGLIVQKVIWKFEEEIAAKEAKLAEEEEGKVVEKEGAADAVKKRSMEDGASAEKKPEPVASEQEETTEE